MLSGCLRTCLHPPSNSSAEEIRSVARKLQKRFKPMQKVRVVQFGLGPIGIESIKLAASKPWIEVIGGVDIDPAKQNRSLGELAGIDLHASVRVHRSLEDLFAAVGLPDVVLHTAGSKADSTLSQIRPAVERGVHVASTCEELIFPRLKSPQSAEACDALCKETGSRVVGVGVNPGFVMDLLPVVIAAVSAEVRAVHCLRVVDASTRRGPLQTKIGSGMAPEDFRAKFARGEAGHAGFQQSLALLAHCLGWQLESIEETCEPVVADRLIQTRHFTVEPGQTRGLHQRAIGRIGGVERIVLDLTMALDEANPRDEIRMEGHPNLELAFPRGVAGDVATVASLINAVPRLLVARPGLNLITDLPIAAPMRIYA
jgi:2,4-diaminopentanoate dehydrogenase